MSVAARLLERVCLPHGIGASQEYDRNHWCRRFDQRHIALAVLGDDFFGTYLGLIGACLREWHDIAGCQTHVDGLHKLYVDTAGRGQVSMAKGGRSLHLNDIEIQEVNFIYNVCYKVRVFAHPNFGNCIERVT